MAFQIRGKLENIGPVTPVQSKKDGSTFYRRDFVIDCTRFDQMTGQPYENHPRFELTGNSCSLIDHLQLGQYVDVKFSLRGTKYTDQYGQVKYFTMINAYSVELVISQAQATSQQQPYPNLQKVSPHPQVPQSPVDSQPQYQPPYSQQPNYQQATPPQGSYDVQNLRNVRNEITERKEDNLPF